MAYDGVMDPDLDWSPARPRGFNTVYGPFEIANSGEGVWRFRLQMDERHVNWGGVCHGGVLFNLLDVTMGVAASAASDDRPSSTINLNLNFLAAAKSEAMLHGEARVARVTRHVCFLEGEVWGGDRLCASAAGIFKYLGGR